MAGRFFLTAGLVLLLSPILPTTPRAAPSRQSSSPRTTATIIVQKPEDWYLPSRLGATASKVATEVLAIKFGASWPESTSRGFDCRPYGGASYSQSSDEYWLYRCQGRWLYNLAPRSDFIYLLKASSKPTLERVLLAFPGIPDVGPDYWGHLRTAINDSLISRTGSPGSAGSATLVLRTGTTVNWTESGDIDCRSAALVSDLASTTWAAGDTWDAEEDTVSNGREEVIRKLTRLDSGLASALASTGSSVHDLPIVARAMEHLSSMPARSHDAHLLRYGTHLWATQWAARLPSGDSTLAHAFNQVLRRYGVKVVETNDGDWCYTGTLVDSLLEMPDDDAWTRNAFLIRMKDGWMEPCGLCGWGSPWGPDYFRPTIERGAAFLSAHPKSPIAPEVALILAEAHETAWSLSKASGENEEYIDRNRYVLDGPAHRVEAIRGYEEHLRTNAHDPRNERISRRLARLRIDVDTDFHRYWCIWD